MKIGKPLIMAFGGMGRNIMFISILRHLAEFFKSNEFDVCASYPDVFKEIFTGNVMNGEYLQQNMSSFRKHRNMDFEPYRAYDYRIGGKHFVQCWLKHEIGIEPAYDKLLLPIMPFGTSIKKEHFDEARKFIDKYQKDKPVAIIQLKGGTSYFSPEKTTCFSFQERQIRSALSSAIVEQLIDSGYKVVRYGLPGEPTVKGVIQSNKVLDFKIWIAMCRIAEKIICVDSSLAHMAASQEKRAMVLWGATSPSCLGWHIHKNIVRTDWPCNGCGRPDTHFGDSGQWTCRHHGECSNHSKDIVEKELERYIAE